jgi:hypothetical protein
MDGLPPARPPLGIGPAIRGCAKTGIQPVTPWFMDSCSTTEPHWPGREDVSEDVTVKQRPEGDEGASPANIGKNVSGRGNSRSEGREDRGEVCVGEVPGGTRAGSETGQITRSLQ